MGRPGMGSEDPVAVGVRGGLVVAGCGGQLAPWSVEWIGECNLDCCNLDGEEIVGDLDVVPGECLEK